MVGGGEWGLTEVADGQATRQRRSFLSRTPPGTAPLRYQITETGTPSAGTETFSVHPGNERCRAGVRDSKSGGKRCSTEVAGGEIGRILRRPAHG